MPTLDRYMLREMMGPALAALLAFVVLITGHVLFTVVDVVAGKGVHMGDIIRFAACKAPEAAVLALPIATLLGCALALNRFASENELIPLIASGISGYRLMVPAIVLGLSASVLSFGLKEFVVPWAGVQAESFYREVLLRQKTLAFKPGKFVETGGPWVLIARDVDRNRDRLFGLRALMKRPGRFPLLVRAETAEFADDYLSAPEVTYHDFSFPRSLTWGTGGLVISLGNISQGAVSGESLQSRSIRQIIRQRANVPEGAPALVREYDLEIHTRLALIAACLVFSLLAVPVALRFGRAQSLAGVLATLVVAFAYFVVMLGLKLLGGNGVLPVAVAAWAQNLVLVAVSLLAMRRL
jgi:lipopolysaccharide export LptBFGC system permease protein LptF